MRSALARHDVILRAAIGESGGEVVKTTGDGMMAVFAAPPMPWPPAIAAQHGPRSRSRGRTTCAIRVRMGIHTGDAEARGGDYFGPAVNRTAPDHGGRSRRPDPAVGRDRGARRGRPPGRRVDCATSGSTG